MLTMYIENPRVYRSLLHVVYLQNESTFTEYLIAKRSDTQATDMQGLKPIEYNGGYEPMMKISQHIIVKLQENK